MVLVAGAGAAGCGSYGGGSSSGNSIEHAQQSIDTDTLVTTLPVPDFATSEIRKNLIEVEAIEALGVKSTTFAFQQGDPDPIWSCPSEGLPVPITDQLTNPDQSQWANGGTNGEAGTVISQMDPNGIYQGDGSGTDVLCLDSNGDPYVHYWEGNVDSVTATATWDTSKHSVKTEGAPVTPTCKVETKTVAGTREDFESCSVPKTAVVISKK
jgi:hypothetical protein